MKFAQSSFVYSNYSLQYAIRSMGRMGYDGIAVWGGRPHMYRQDLHAQLPEIRDLLAEHRMEVCHVVPAQFRYPSLLASSNEKVRRDSVRYIMDNVDNALLLGAPSLHVCAGMSLLDQPLERGWDCLRRSIIEILETMRGTGLRLYIEPAHRFESNQILTLDDGLRMIREIGDPQLGILLDTGHLHVNGEDLAEGVAKLGPLLGHVDLDDNDGSADAHLAPGAGTIDFAPFAAALNAPATRAMCRPSWACNMCSILNPLSPPAWRGCGRLLRIAEKVTRRDDSPMRLSVVLSVQQAQFEAVAFKGNLEANLVKIAGWGYDGVELAIRDPQAVDAEELAALVAAHGLTVPAIGTGQAWGEEHLSYSDPDPTVRRAAIERTKSHIPVARRLGAIIIIGLLRGLVQPGVSQAQALDWTVAALRECCAEAAKLGVRLALEPINRYETTLVNTVAQGLELIDRVGAENLGCSSTPSTPTSRSHPWKRA